MWWVVLGTNAAAALYILWLRYELGRESRDRNELQKVADAYGAERSDLLDRLSRANKVVKDMETQLNDLQAKYLKAMSPGDVHDALSGLLSGDDHH